MNKLKIKKRIKEFNDGYKCGVSQTLQNVKTSLLLQKTHNEGEDSLIRELVEKVDYQIQKLDNSCNQQDAGRLSSEMNDKPLKESGAHISIPADNTQIKSKASRNIK